MILHNFPLMILIGRGRELSEKLDVELLPESHYYVAVYQEKDTDVVCSGPYDTHDSCSKALFEFERSLFEMIKHLIRPN